MNEFKRENRYLVMKRSDIDKYLTPKERDDLSRIVVALESQRENDGKTPLECVVVESDWPEFEPVWKMIEARCAGSDKSEGAGDLVEQLKDVQHDAQCECTGCRKEDLPRPERCQCCNCHARAAIRLGIDYRQPDIDQLNRLLSAAVAKADRQTDEIADLRRKNAVMREALEEIKELTIDDYRTGAHVVAEKALAAGGE